MSLALGSNPQVSQSLGIGGGGGSPTQIISPDGSTLVKCNNGALQSYGLTTRFETSPNTNSAYVDIRESGNDNMYVSLNAEGTTNVAHVKVGGTSTNDGLYVGATQLLYNGVAVGGIPPVLAGVESLQGLVGALTFSSSDDSININPSGTVIDLTSNGGGGGGVSTLSDGNTVISGNITFLGQGLDIKATNDPSPAMTFSVPVQEAVTTLNGTSGTVLLTSADGTIALTPDVNAGTIDLSVVGVVSSISDGTTGAKGAVVISGGEGIEIVFDAPTNTFTLTSDPFVGIYYLTTPQDITIVPPAQVQKAVGLTADPNTDTSVVSYDGTTGTWTVLKSGVYFLNFSAGVIHNDAIWTFGSFCQCYIVCILGGSSPQLEICNNTTPNQASGVGSWNAQVFGYLPLTIGTTITAGIQWIITSAGTPTPAQFQPRVNNINNGTGFNWAYVKPLTA